MLNSNGLDRFRAGCAGQLATYRFRTHYRKLKRITRQGFYSICWVCCLLAVAACAPQPKRTYLDPSGGDAEQCLQVCQSERFACRTPIQRLDEDCQYRYRIAYSQFQRCLQIRGNRGGCTKPRGCSVPNYTACAVGYDQCFVGCGGQILTGDEDYRED
ncbi:MAG: hypothetical protein AB8B96_02715 [Lysobacterales bacterium]